MNDLNYLNDSCAVWICELILLIHAFCLWWIAVSNQARLRDLEVEVEGLDPQLPSNGGEIVFYDIWSIYFNVDRSLSGALNGSCYCSILSLVQTLKVSLR